MNTNLLLSIASRIEAEPQHFDMGRWYECGTIGCIAGQALILQNVKPKRNIFGTAEGVAESAAKLLDIGEFTWRELFFANSLDREYFDDEGRMRTIEGIDVVQCCAAHVPAALRWMVENDCYIWAEALSDLEVEIRQ